MSGDPLHPSEGMRLLLERRAVRPDGAGATYRAAIYTPDQLFEYEAELGIDGSAELDPGPTPPAPAELEDKLRAHARQTARAAARRAADELPPWPHRVLRWRGPGRG